MNELVIEKYGNDVIKLIMDNKALRKSSIGMIFGSAIGIGMPGGYKPEMYLAGDKLVKYIKGEITEYDIVDKFEDGEIILSSYFHYV